MRCQQSAHSTQAVCDGNLTIIWVGRSCRERERERERESFFHPGSGTLLLLGKWPLVCMTDEKKNRIWSSSATSLSPPPSLLLGHAPSLSLSHTPSFGLPVPPSLSLSHNKHYQKNRAQGGEIVLALKACFTLTHVSGGLRLHLSVQQNGQDRLSPCHSSQTPLASGERQRRDRASGKRQCTQLLGRGRGNLGWWVRGVKKGGEGAEVRVVCMCVCGSVSIVVGTFFFSFSPLSSEWGLQVQLLPSLSTVFSPCVMLPVC